MKENETTKVFSSVVSEDGTRGTIRVEGEITWHNLTDEEREDLGNNYYTPDDFKNALKDCADCAEIELVINSLGGSTFTGIAIYNALAAMKAQGKKIVTRVEGIAASAASVIFCAGDERIVYPGSLVMVHGASALVCNSVNVHTADELVANVKTLKSALVACNKSFAAIYGKATGRNEDEFLVICDMGKEKWYSGEEAIESGLATRMDEGAEAVELKLVAHAGKTELYSRGRLLTKDFQAVDALAKYGIEATAREQPATDSRANLNPRNMEKNETKPAVEEPEVKAETPAPVAITADEKAAIAESARKEERARIAEINALAEKLGGRVTSELTEKAIAEGMTPEAYAHAAVKSLTPEPVKDAGTAYLQARANETSVASNLQVTPAPEPVDPNSPQALAARYVEARKGNGEGNSF